MEYYSVIGSEYLITDTSVTWVNFKVTVLSGKSQTKMSTFCMIVI